MRYVPGLFLLALLILGYSEFFHVREASDSPALPNSAPAAVVHATLLDTAAVAAGRGAETTGRGLLN